LAADGSSADRWSSLKIDLLDPVHTKIGDLDRALWGLQHGWVIGSAATSLGFLEP